MDRKAVSPDSSTQVADKGKKSKKRRHKHRSKKKKSKKFKSSDSSLEVESDGSNKLNKKTNTEDERNLVELLNNREELQAQLFSIFPKREVKKIMPDILKKLSFKEVKKLCFQQLELLSNKRLRCIISGEEMSSSSDDNEEDPANLAKPPNLREILLCQNLEEEANGKEDVHVGGKEERVKEEKEEEKKDIFIFQEMITIPNQQEIDELVEGGSSAHDQFTEGSPQSNEDIVVEEAELKELEFRARALESLVRARERQTNTEHA